MIQLTVILSKTFILCYYYNFVFVYRERGGYLRGSLLLQQHRRTAGNPTYATCRKKRLYFKGKHILLTALKSNGYFELSRDPWDKILDNELIYIYSVVTPFVHYHFCINKIQLKYPKFLRQRLRYRGFNTLGTTVPV